VNEKISCNEIELHILFIYILVSHMRGEQGINVVYAWISMIIMKGKIIIVVCLILSPIT